MPCDSYELHADGTANIYEAGFDAFQVESLPATLDLTVLVGLLMEEGETASLEMNVIGPLMTGVMQMDHPITADPRSSHVPGNYVSQIEPLEVEYPVETAGGYVINIYSPDPISDGHSFFFSVIEGLP